LIVEPRKPLRVPSPGFVAWPLPLSCGVSGRRGMILGAAARVLALLRGTAAAQGRRLVTV